MPPNPLTIARTLSADVATRADAADIAGELPAADVQALRDSGYLTLTIPREYGGYGLSMRDALACQLELAQGSASTAIVAGMPLHIFAHAGETHPWDETRFAQFCNAVVQEGALFNSIASEPMLGSPSRGGLPATTVTPHPDGWQVDGRKTWSTGGKFLTHMLVKVTVDDGELPPEPGVVLVQQQTPGVRWEPTWRDSLSLRASDSHDLFLEGAVVPAEHLILRGRPPVSYPNAWFPMMMAGIYLGTAIAARNAVIQFALERVPTGLGKPISTLPKIQRQIGEIDLALQAAQSLFFQVAGEWTGRAEDRAAQMPRITTAKHFATEVANQVTDSALRIGGGQAITRALPLERYFRDVRAGLMQPPSGDTALEVIGRAAIDRRETAGTR